MADSTIGPEFVTRIRDQTELTLLPEDGLSLVSHFQSVSPVWSRIPVTNSGSARPAITAKTGEEGCAFRIRPSPNVCLKSLLHVFFTGDSLRVQPRDRPSRSVITRY